MGDSTVLGAAVGQLSYDPASLRSAVGRNRRASMARTDISELMHGECITHWKRLTVTRLGRFFIRNICMVFDRYLREGRERARYSKVV